MSQKPKAGTQPRAASIIRPPAKAVEAASEAVEAPAKIDEALASPTPEPVIEAEPVIEMVPAAASEPVAYEAIPTVVTTTETVSEPIAATAEAVTEAITTSADTASAVTAEAIAPVAALQPTQTSVTQGIKTMMKSTEDFVAFGQANLEAFVKSGQIWSTGMQELTKQFASTAKASFEESVSTFKAITTAKSVKEAMDLQSTFAKAALEKAMAESNKLTDASIKLTEQTLAPITARVTVAVETFGKAA